MASNYISKYLSVNKEFIRSWLEKAVYRVGLTATAVMVATVMTVIVLTVIDTEPHLDVSSAVALQESVHGGDSVEVAIDYCAKGDVIADVAVQYRHTNGGFFIGEIFEGDNGIVFPDGCGVVVQDVFFKGGLEEGQYFIELVITHSTNPLNEVTSIERTQRIEYICCRN